MIDFTAPIVPGYAAGGVILGMRIENILQDTEIPFSSHRVSVPGVGDLGTVEYRSDSIYLWARQGIIWQIMVRGDYQGKTAEGIGIGSTFEDIRKLIGPIVLFDERYIVRGILKGICFEPEQDREPYRVVEIYIYEPDWTEDVR